MVFKHRGGAGGMAVLSRLPLVETEFLPPTGDGWFPAARVVVQTAFGRLQALSVHLHPPVSEGGSFISGHFTTPAVRAGEIETFFARLEPALPTLIAGDFNEEEDGNVMKFLTGKGMLSALQRFAPDQPTWRWDTAVGTLHRQLDHVVYDRRLEVVSAEIRVAGRSDHLPVIAVVTRGGRPTQAVTGAPGPSLVWQVPERRSFRSRRSSPDWSGERFVGDRPRRHRGDRRSSRSRSRRRR